MVMGSEITLEMMKRVMMELVSAYKDLIALEKPVSLVCGQEEGVKIISNMDRSSASDFTPVPQVDVIRKSQLPQP